MTIRCESPIEWKLYKAMLDFGLLPTRQYEIGYYRVDFAFLEERLIVEANGRYYHSSKKQKNYDKIREQYLRSKGWKVLRFTGSQIFKDANKCAKKIKIILKMQEQKN